VFGNVIALVTYYINSYDPSGDTFTITDTIGGTDLVLTTDNGQMTLTADNPYIIVSGTITSDEIKETTLTQDPISAPTFNVGKKLGGYTIEIVDQGEGYTFDNTITISGADLGGTTPLNDLVLTVDGIDVITANPNFSYSPDYNFLLPLESDGTITSVIGSGTPAGIVRQYYLKVISATQCEVYANPLLNVPVNGLVLETEYTLGDYVFLPEPFYFNQSIVKYNNQVWQCIISNNDNEFIIGKWELLDSGSRKLNELDRIIGYYAPTVNMPGVDLTQLIDGITYPNGTYLDNAFAPEDQYTLDTILQDQPFYPTSVDTVAMSWNGTRYVGVINTPDYTASILSTDATTWTVNKVVNTPVNATDIAYADNLYVVTCNNSTTPIYISVDGIVFTTSAGGTGSLTVDSTSLSSVAYGGNVWVAVGENIVASVDTLNWAEVDSFTNGLVNNLNSVSYVSIPSFVGFVSVGNGQETISGSTQAVSVIQVSTDGYYWTKIPVVSYNGFNGVASSSSIIVAVGDEGVIYTSLNGSNWSGVNESNIISVNASTNVINVGSTTGFEINDIVRFTQSFDVISSSTTYYVVDVISATQIQVSTTLGGLPVTLTGSNPSSTTFMYIYPRSTTLNDVVYANSLFMAVGNDGTIRTSSDGYAWDDEDSGVTENLTGIVYNADDNEWLVTGDNNVIIASQNNGTDWTSSSVFSTNPTVYDVQGDAFTAGYGPEELVPGVVTDNLTMIVTTRPGTDWDTSIYGHAGYNVVSTEIVPDSGQTIFSFEGIVENPANMSLFDITTATNTSVRIYDFTVDWVNKVVTLGTALVVDHTLRLDVYEVGNGNQLVKANSQTIPFVDNDSTGFVEMPLNCNYSANRFNGSGVIRPNTFTNTVYAIETDALDNGIVCTDVDNFTINSSIVFQGAVFGGIESGATYWIKTVSNITNKITVSETISGGISGPTFDVISATGTMIVNIQSINGLVWTDPILIHNGTNLVLGEQGIVSETKSGTNTIVVNSTANYEVGDTVVFSNAIATGTFITCGLTAQTTYYITSIIGNEFTVSLTLGGANEVLTNATGIALCITNDYAITIADQGITANIVFANQYNQANDFVVFSVFGETAPTQYGYTVPEVEVFEFTDPVAEFTLSNYVGGDNPKNAIVEYNGLRLVEASDYIIDFDTTTLSLNFAPDANSTIAVTSYNLTDRQYLHTTYGGTFSGSTTNSFLIGSTTHTPSYDAELIVGELIVGTDYVITDLGTTTQTDWNTIAGTSAIVYVVGDVITCADSGVGMGDGVVAIGWGETWSPGPDFLTLSSGSTASLTINDAITFTGTTFGGIVANQTYYVVTIISSTEFAVSETPGGVAIQLTTDSGSMTGITNPPTVSNITGVTNLITEPTTVGIISVTSTGNVITCSSTTGFSPSQPIQFKSSSPSTPYGNVLCDGTVYFVSSVVNGTEFIISETPSGAEFDPGNDSGTLLAEVGGNPAVSVTTGIAHNLVENDIVRIDGTTGSIQLNNNTYYAKIVTATEIALYNSPYDPTANAINDPVTIVSTWTGGGYVWLDKTFTITTTLATATDVSTNDITVSSSLELISGTPIIFTGSVLLGGLESEVTAGSFTEGNTYQINSQGTTDFTLIGALNNNVGTNFVATGVGTGTGIATAIYYVYDKPSATTFRVTAVRDGDVFALTNDTGSMNVSQWEQDNVDRLWVTVNGKRIPSSALRLNPDNNLSILTTVVPGDVVIVTSMIPTATPNQAVYLQNVSKTGVQSVFRANSLTRTWLTVTLQNTDDTIYVEDVTKITETIIQNEVAPAEVDGIISIGLEGDKQAICQVIVYNNNTVQTVNPADYYIAVEATAPILKITNGVSEDDSLTITVILGNLIYVNGEQIGFTTVDFATNTVTGLQRGANGTGEQTIIPKYTEVYSILPSNELPNVYNAFVWNSYNYNLVDGDPLQISTTVSANFLNADVP
jgi:hypothetical protein